LVQLVPLKTTHKQKKGVGRQKAFTKLPVPSEGEATLLKGEKRLKKSTELGENLIKKNREKYEKNNERYKKEDSGRIVRNRILKRDRKKVLNLQVEVGEMRWNSGEEKKGSREKKKKCDNTIWGWLMFSSCRGCRDSIREGGAEFNAPGLWGGTFWSFLKRCYKNPKPAKKTNRSTTPNYFLRKVFERDMTREKPT